ncbi:MAG: PAS-domain containing protein [Alphaproteobacteria bacterium]|nr:PAS-domain containing protein [Alphaproteobacteria bacterium]
MTREPDGGTAITSPTSDDARLRDVLEACPIGAAILAQDNGQRMFVNSALVKMMGATSRDALLHENIVDTWVDDSCLNEAWTAFREERQMVNFEAERVRADGSRWWVLMNTQSVTFEGVAAGIVWHIDITIGKQAEKARLIGENRLRDAVEGLSEAFALFDPDDKLVFCNHMFRSLNPDLATILHPDITFEEMLRDNLANKRIIEAIGLEESYFQERMALHRSPAESPSLSERSDGRWLLLYEKKAPDGSTYLVNTDMTELKIREDALRLEKENAEYANSAKSEFLANMSHELRTPLNAIIGFSEVLDRQFFGEIGDPRYREYITDIHTSGKQLLALINDILNIVEIEAGRHVLDLTPVDFGEIIRKSCEIIKPDAKRQNVQLRRSVSKSLPVLQADPRALRQIMLNLLSNAIKFTPAGGEINVLVKENRGGGIKISVKDTGVGIAKEDLKFILTPFGRLGSEAVAHPGRTGLGLPIVKALVDLHGGSMKIHSTLGEGTRITLRFPPID